jgi:hypothetical protein
MKISDSSRIYRRNGRLIIEVPEPEILALARGDAASSVAVEEADAFLNGVVDEIRLQAHSRDGAADSQTCLDFLIERAIYGAGEKERGSKIFEPPISDQV